MQTESRVLVIESDSAIGKEMQSVLNFIGSTPVLVNDSEHWQDALEDEEQLQAVMLGSCNSGRTLSEVLNEIHQFDEHLPVYLLSDKGKEPTVAIDSGSCILGRLELPPNYAQLTNALHQAEIYTESHRHPPSEQRQVDLFRSLVGSSRAIQNVRKLIQQVADSDARS